MGFRWDKMTSILQQLKDNPLSKLSTRLKELAPAQQVIAGGLIGGAAATLAPVQVGISKAATGAVALIKANPAISSVGGIIGAGAVAREPQKALNLVDKALPTAQKGVSSLYDFGGDVAQIKEVKDIVNVAKEHPLITSGLGLLLAGGAARGVSSGIILGKTLAGDDNKQSSYLDYEPIIPNKNITPDTPSKDKDSGLIKDDDQQPPSITPPPVNPDDSTQLVSYSQTPPTTYKKRKKAKNIYRSPITIRNNILISNIN